MATTRSGVRREIDQPSAATPITGTNPIVMDRLNVMHPMAAPAATAHEVCSNPRPYANAAMATVAKNTEGITVMATRLCSMIPNDSNASAAATTPALWLANRLVMA